MQDLRDAFRALIAAPIVTAVAVLSLALGIGANTAIFSILDSLLIRTLPVADPQALHIVGAGRDRRVTSWTNPIWEQIRDRSSSFDGTFAWWTTRFNLSESGQTEFVDGLWASGGYFEVLGVRALLGRTLTPADDQRGGGPDGPVAVIGYNMWQRRFGGAADVVGRSLTIERVSYTIVGVTPPGFFGVDVGRTFDVAIPIGTEPLMRGKESALDERSYWWLSVMVRLKKDQSVEAGDAVLRGVLPQIREATLPHTWRPQDKADYLRDGVSLIAAATGDSLLRRRYRQPLTAIMVVVALVLLIACANIANLLLARATARRHELTIRVALGASRTRIARQLLGESLMLAGAGALLGLAFAQWGSRLLVRQLSTTTNNVFLDLSIDWRVLAFTAGVAMLTAVLFGMAPALRGMRVRPNDALKSQGRGVIGDGRLGLANVLVVIQVALSLILVVAAGLFVRTFVTLAGLDFGFDQDKVLVTAVNTQRLQAPEARPELYRRFVDAAAALPGVEAAGLSAVTPTSGSTWSYRIELPDGPELPERERLTYINYISEDWFRTYGTQVIAGRDFARTDTATSQPVAIVNETFARTFIRAASPIGARVRQAGQGTRPAIDRVIVGYVRDAVYRSPREPVPPTMYVPFTQHGAPPATMFVSVRAAGGAPALLTKTLAAALTPLHGDVAITFRPLSDQVNAVLTQERVVAMLAGFFGGLALLLAGLGLYGVTSYAVSRRRSEIGVRMALGAAPGAVIGLVLRRVAVLVGLGVLAGGGISLWASSFVTTLLYGLAPRDPMTLASAAAILIAVGALAGWVPARRASHIDPAVVLREG